MNRAPLAGPLALRLALRLLGAPKGGLLSSTARAALLAVALGVAALGVTMALMTGYREDLATKLVGGSAPILVYRTGDAEPGERAFETLAGGIEGVTGIAPTAFREAIVAAGEREAEVTVRGLSSEGAVFGLPSGSLGKVPGGGQGALVGKRLAERLAVGVGDRLRLTLLALEGGEPRFAFRSLEVTGLFESGFSEFDRSWIVVDRELIRSAPGGGGDAWEVQVDRLDRSAGIAEELRAALGERYLVLDWRDLYRGLFSALELLQRTLFLLVGLIVLVATFNVASTIVVLVRERRRDLGVLAALGVAPATLRRSFLLVAGFLGAGGAAAGLLVAGVLSRLATRFEWLSFGPEMEEVYFVRSIPLRLELADASIVALFACAVALVAAWLPAQRSARLSPSAAIRFE